MFVVRFAVMKYHKKRFFGFMALMVGVGWGVLYILQMVNLLLLLLH